VLGRTDQQASATSTLTAATDPGRQLHAAVERYLDAYALAESTGLRSRVQAASGGPLPWLPPPPGVEQTTLDSEQLADYLQQRADLVHTLAATITADHLPDTAWADHLRQADPHLARRLAVWRAATGVTDHPDPVGSPDTPTPEMRAHLQPLVATHLLDHDDEGCGRQLDAGPAWIRPAERVGTRALDHRGARSISR
jgi:hypothetical protein